MTDPVFFAPSGRLTLAEVACIAGGEVARVPGKEGGFYVRPTVYADVDNGMRIRVIDLATLIEIKRSTGRVRDHLAVPILESLLRRRAPDPDAT